MIRNNFRAYQKCNNIVVRQLMKQSDSIAGIDDVWVFYQVPVCVSHFYFFGHIYIYIYIYIYKEYRGFTSYSPLRNGPLGSSG